MNRRLKRTLAASFSPPPPQRKTVFLRTLPQPDLSLGTFLWNQIPYLRKRTWLLSCGVLLPAVWGGSYMNPNVLWITAALLPFVALLAVTEGTRSAVYGMEELELATRFSLKSVLLARLCLVGSLHAVLLLCLTLLCRGTGAASFGRTVVYLLVPYLLTAYGGLWLSRRLRGREMVYGTAVLAVLVSSGYLLAVGWMQTLFAPWNFPGWLLAAAVLSVALARELALTKKGVEEAWNLSFER